MSGQAGGLAADFDRRRWVALSGGVGGAKLSLGLAQVLGSRLTVIVNTGDDFEHLGLHISPDIDTALYTLAGLANPDTGWGRRDETWTFMNAIADLGGPTWFKLGDADLALHVERTRRLRAGEGLTDFCAHACRRFGIAASIVPVSDDCVRTVVDTDRGTLSFQEYFVREQCEPAVRAIRVEGAKAARPSAAAVAALADPELGGIIICPSNPYLSIDPLLAVPGFGAAIHASGVPVIAITPIIAGKGVKGPVAKIMRELDITPTAVSVARHYAGLIDGFVLDVSDADQERELMVSALVVNTLMRTLGDKVALARACLNFCDRLTAKASHARSGASMEVEP
jgi:LPPG:FO 2-phospho-L-lactate transferase